MRHSGHRTEHYPRLKTGVIEPDRVRTGRLERSDVREVIPHIVHGGRKLHGDPNHAFNVLRLEKGGLTR